MKDNPPRLPGRPRKFDRDKALDCAVTTFWAKGYSGASLADLTTNMAINRPSLYAAFGNKHDLFMEVIDRYSATLGYKPVKALYSESNIEKAIEAFFEASIHCVTSNGPRGCLIACVASEVAEIDQQVRNKLTRIFAETDKVVADRFLMAQDEGQLHQDADPQVLAQMTISIGHSFATRARVGASPRALFRLARGFMVVLFPKS